MLCTWGQAGGLNAALGFFAPLTTSLALKRGSGSPTFVRATTATVLGFRSTDNASTGPVVVNVASGEARFHGARRIAQDNWSSTYANGSLIPTSILLGFLGEQASTNLVLQSSNFGTTWVPVGTPTRSAAADTCGDLVLDLIGDDDGTALEGYTQAITFTGDNGKALSFFVKAGTSTSSVIRLRDTTAGADRLLVTLAWAGGVPTPTVVTGALRGVDVLGNGAYRIRIQTAVVTAANVNSVEVYPATDAALAVGNTGNVLVGGLQGEDNLFGTSLIQTTTATVTRNMDTLTYPVAGNVIDASGMAYAELTMIDHAPGFRALIGDAGAATSRLFVNGANFDIGAFDGTNTITKSGPFTGTIRAAMSWVGAELSVTANGGVPTSGAYDGAFAFSVINILQGASAHNNGMLRNVKIWKVGSTAALPGL